MWNFADSDRLITTVLVQLTRRPMCMRRPQRVSLISPEIRQMERFQLAAKEIDELLARKEITAAGSRVKRLLIKVLRNFESDECRAQHIRQIAERWGHVADVGEIVQRYRYEMEAPQARKYHNRSTRCQ